MSSVGSVVVFIAGDMKFFYKKNFKRLCIKKILNRFLGETMQIDIVNFYETLREDGNQFLQGTLHVYLADLGIDLRGIFVSKKKECWYFSLPSRRAQDVEGRLIHYPITSYRDREKTNQLMQIVKEKGRSFIEEYLKNNPQQQEAEKEAKQQRPTSH